MFTFLKSVLVNKWKVSLCGVVCNKDLILHVRAYAFWYSRLYLPLPAYFQLKCVSSCFLLQGPVSFTESGDREGLIEIRQLRGTHNILRFYLLLKIVFIQAVPEKFLPNRRYFLLQQNSQSICFMHICIGQSLSKFKCEKENILLLR